MNIQESIGFIDSLITSRETNVLTGISKRNTTNVRTLLQTEGFIDALQQTCEEKFVRMVENPARKALLSRIGELSTMFHGTDRLFSRTNDVPIPITPAEITDLVKDSITLGDTGSPIRVALNTLTRQFNYDIVINEKVTMKLIVYYTSDDIDNRLVKTIAGRIFTLARLKYENLNTPEEDVQKYNDLLNNFPITIALYWSPRASFGQGILENIPESVNFMRNSGCFNSSSGITEGTKADFMPPVKMTLSRDNEVLGLLTHELGHLFGYDTGIIDLIFDTPGTAVYQPKNFDNWQDTYTENMGIISEDHKLFGDYEGINNANTSVIHAMFNSVEYLLNSRKYSLDASFGLYKKFLLIEFVHAMIQCSRLIKWFGFESFEGFALMKETKEKETKENRRYQQDAMMFEYIFLRLLILFNYDDCMNILFQNGGNIMKPHPYSVDIRGKLHRILTGSVKDLTRIMNIVFRFHADVLARGEDAVQPNNSNTCGKYLMEYFAVDMRGRETNPADYDTYRGGSTFKSLDDYKYNKYKKKYVDLKQKYNELLYKLRQTNY
jgi:hypothetical protein